MQAGGGELAHIDGIAVRVGHGRAGQAVFGGSSAVHGIGPEVEVAQLIANEEFIVAVAVQVAERGHHALHAIVRQGEPIGVQLLEGGGGGRSHIAEPGEQGRRVARSEVALLTGHHKVREPVIVEVGEGRVGAAAHIDHAVL